MITSLLASVALAGTPVVIAPAADPAEALGRVAEATGIPLSELEPVAADALLPSAPFLLVGGGRADGCSGPLTSMADVRDPLDKAESAVAYLDFDGALPRLQQAADALSCLGEPVDASAASRIYYLRGIVAHGTGDGASAEAAFRQAHAYASGLKWDANFAPDALPLFEAAAVAEGAAGRFAVVPRQSALWIDGDSHAGTAEVLPGAHLVQFGNPVATWRVFVGAGTELRMVVPGLVTAEAIAWVDDPTRHGDLEAIVDAARPGGMVYFVHGEDVWRVDSKSVERLGAPSGTGGGGGGGPKLAATGLTIGGGALFVGGGALTAVTFLQGRSAEKDWDAAIAADDWQARDAALDDYDAARGRLGVPRALAIAGAGLALTGVTLGVVF